MGGVHGYAPGYKSHLIQAFTGDKDHDKAIFKLPGLPGFKPALQATQVTNELQTEKNICTLFASASWSRYNSRRILLL